VRLPPWCSWSFLGLVLSDSNLHLISSQICACLERAQCPPDRRLAAFVFGRQLSHRLARSIAIGNLPLLASIKARRAAWRRLVAKKLQLSAVLITAGRPQVSNACCCSRAQAHGWAWHECPPGNAVSTITPSSVPLVTVLKSFCVR
jgi:hypothetical protein